MGPPRAGKLEIASIEESKDFEPAFLAPDYEIQHSRRPTLKQNIPPV
jgi:hypothetical protein